MGFMDLGLFSPLDRTCPECGCDATMAQQRWLGQSHLRCDAGHEWTVTGCAGSGITDASVFQDAADEWQGRYRDKTDSLKGKKLPEAHDAESAKQLWARYLGVKEESVEIRAP